MWLQFKAWVIWLSVMGSPWMDGVLPPMDDPNYQLDNPNGDAYLLNSKVASCSAPIIPSGATISRETAEAVMEYREHLCKCLDRGPVVICFDLQDHYGEPRADGEPYIERPGERFLSHIELPWFREVRDSHCVTAYGYVCPGGDVRTLKVMYQENMVGAPGAQPGRHDIHPDSVHRYFVPLLLEETCVKNHPMPGYMKAKWEAPPKRTMWEVIRSKFF